MVKLEGDPLQEREETVLQSSLLWSGPPSDVRKESLSEKIKNLKGVIFFGPVTYLIQLTLNLFYSPSVVQKYCSLLKQRLN